MAQSSVSLLFYQGGNGRLFIQLPWKLCCTAVGCRAEDISYVIRVPGTWKQWLTGTVGTENNLQNCFRTSNKADKCKLFNQLWKTGVCEGGGGGGVGGNSRPLKQDTPNGWLISARRLSPECNSEQLLSPSNQNMHGHKLSGKAHSEHVDKDILICAAPWRTLWTVINTRGGIVWNYAVCQSVGYLSFPHSSQPFQPLELQRNPIKMTVFCFLKLIM